MIKLRIIAQVHTYVCIVYVCTYIYVCTYSYICMLFCSLQMRGYIQYFDKCKIEKSLGIKCSKFNFTCHPIMCPPLRTVLEQRLHCQGM